MKDQDILSHIANLTLAWFTVWLWSVEWWLALMFFLSIAACLFFGQAEGGPEEKKLGDLVKLNLPGEVKPEKEKIMTEWDYLLRFILAIILVALGKLYWRLVVSLATISIAAY